MESRGASSGAVVHHLPRSVVRSLGLREDLSNSSGRFTAVVLAGSQLVDLPAHDRVMRRQKVVEAFREVGEGSDSSEKDVSYCRSLLFDGVDRNENC